MGRNDHAAGRRAGAMRRAVASVGAAGLVLVTCTGCPDFGEFQVDGEFEVINGTSETLEIGRTGALAPGETRMFEIEEDSCELHVELLTADHTQVVDLENPCDGDRIELTADGLRPQAAVAVANDSDVPLRITFTGEYRVTEHLLAPGEELVIPILEGTCVSDGMLFADVPAVPGREAMMLAHPGELCGGTRWAIDEETLDAGVATMTLHNETSLPLEARLDVAMSAMVRVGAGGSARVSLGVPVSECLNEDLFLLAETSGGDLRLAGTVFGPLCDGEMTVTEAMVARPSESGLSTEPPPTTETEGHAAVRVVNQTGAELVVDLVGPVPYTVSVGPDSSATVILDAAKSQCVDASLRASSVPDPGGVTLQAVLPGPLCDGEWVVTADMLTAGG